MVRPRRLVGAIAASAVVTMWAIIPIARPVGASGSAAAATPVQHVVVLMQENRSFDTYFGHLHDYQVAKYGSSNVEAEPANASNPNPYGGPPIAAFHKTDYCEVADLNHSWTGSHQEYDGGLMDGFTAANINAKDPTGSRTMGYYTQADLPYYYDLYSTFATSDRQFASTLTQTFPNRFYLLGGTSFGHIKNDFPLPVPNLNAFDQPTVFDRLDQQGVSWKIYFSEIPFAFEFGYARNHALGHVYPISQYYIDAALGQLPQVSYVDPIFLGPAVVENDEHPSSNVQVGQQFVAGVVQSLFHSPQWGSSALFLTYDEHGGFYDHVAPPAAVPPDGIAPMLQYGDTVAGFDRFGIRVPLAVISPYTKAHFVSHVPRDHTSILRFIEDNFHLGTLTARDAAADNMTEFFDFSHPQFPSAPALAPATIDLLQLLKCLTAPPNGAF